MLDPLVGTDRLDFVLDLGARMPMAVIGMLLGIPEEDQEDVRLHKDDTIRREPGQPGEFSEDKFADAAFFEEYINWRRDNPSDDLMTQLIQAEFEDETGTVRCLTHDELLIFVNILATAGNETTNRVIGHMGKILAEHPDQRRELVEDRTLIPNAVEEILRFEPPALQACRYVTRDVELHGEKVPEGATMMASMASGNHDHRAFPPDSAHVRDPWREHHVPARQRGRATPRAGAPAPAAWSGPRLGGGHPLGAQLAPGDQGRHRPARPGTARGPRRSNDRRGIRVR